MAQIRSHFERLTVLSLQSSKPHSKREVSGVGALASHTSSAKGSGTQGIHGMFSGDGVIPECVSGSKELRKHIDASPQAHGYNLPPAAGSSGDPVFARVLPPASGSSGDPLFARVLPAGSTDNKHEATPTLSTCSSTGLEAAVGKFSNLSVAAAASTNGGANSFSDGSLHSDGESNPMHFFMGDSTPLAASVHMPGRQKRMPLNSGVMNEAGTGGVERTWQQTGRPSEKPVINATELERFSGPDLLSQLFEGGDLGAEGDDADEVSVSEASESDENSDDEDIFEMKAGAAETLSTEYQGMWLYRWQLAVARLSLLFRDDVLLPLNPFDAQGVKVWTDVQSGIVLPPWHCAFANCGAAEATVESCRHHEDRVWQHVWRSGAHKEVLRKCIQQFRLRGSSQTEEEVAFTLYGLALADKERACCPRVGLATDRRTLGHIGEVFQEENIQTLVCFICGCKHVSHEGVDKFGKPQEKGTISFRRHTHLHKLLQSVGEGSGRYNHSFKFYKDRFGKATAAAPDLLGKVSF